MESSNTSNSDDGVSTIDGLLSEGSLSLGAIIRSEMAGYWRIETRVIELCEGGRYRSRQYWWCCAEGCGHSGRQLATHLGLTQPSAYRHHRDHHEGERLGFPHRPRGRPAGQGSRRTAGQIRRDRSRYAERRGNPAYLARLAETQCRHRDHARVAAIAMAAAASMSMEEQLLHYPQGIDAWMRDELAAMRLRRMTARPVRLEATRVRLHQRAPLDPHGRATQGSEDVELSQILMSAQMRQRAAGHPWGESETSRAVLRLREFQQKRRREREADLDVGEHRSSRQRPLEDVQIIESDELRQEAASPRCCIKILVHWHLHAALIWLSSHSQWFLVVHIIDPELRRQLGVRPGSTGWTLDSTASQLSQGFELHLRRLSPWFVRVLGEDMTKCGQTCVPQQRDCASCGFGICISYHRTLAVLASAMYIYS